MKKIIAMALVLVMALGMFAGCSEEKKAEPTAAPTTEAPATEAPTTEAATEGETNAATEGTEIATEAATEAATEEATEGTGEAAAFTTVTPGKLTMATNAYFPPYEYYEGEQIIGIDAEIAAAIAEKLGLELEIIDMNFDSIISSVKAGSADMGLAGMTVTAEREQEINFSISYASGVQSIIVKEGSAITSVDDLYAEGAAYKVGVQLGTTGDIYATGDFGEELVTQYTTGNEAVAALLGGDVDCVIIDNEPAKAFVAANEGLTILETSYADEDYAACLSKENPALLEAVDNAILELTEEGVIDEIIGKYIQ